MKLFHHKLIWIQKVGNFVDLPVRGKVTGQSQRECTDINKKAWAPKSQSQTILSLDDLCAYQEAFIIRQEGNVEEFTFGIRGGHEWSLWSCIWKKVWNPISVACCGHTVPRFLHMCLCRLPSPRQCCLLSAEILKNCALRFSNRGRTLKNRSPLAGWARLSAKCT